MTRRKRADLRDPGATVADAAQPALELRIRRFDWLEGATGVQLLVRSRRGLRTVQVAGQVDRASLSVIEDVLSEALTQSAVRVELDLSGVTFLDDAGNEMIARASARSRERDVPLHIIWTRSARPTMRARVGASRKPNSQPRNDGRGGQSSLVR